MEIPFHIVVGIGLALCAVAVAQIALWSSARIRFARQEEQQFSTQLQDLRHSLGTVNPVDQNRSAVSELTGTSWRGFRQFEVVRLTLETATTTSVYLAPADGKPIANFWPGQHLTLKLNIPGHPKPIIRCYTLSDRPEKSHYRISVKEVAAPVDRPDLAPGKASHFINRVLQVGAVIDVKAPSGDFFLNEDSNRLVVLLAGGIGITPMISMIEWLVESKSNRSVLLLYGVRNGNDHPFNETMQNLPGLGERVHVVNCYSRPLASERLGQDYQVHGNVSATLLQHILKIPDAEFYLCGPPPFMDSLYDGLLEWGVPAADIRYEAFGLASIKQRDHSIPAVVPQTALFHPVKFSRSEKTVLWNGQQSLLELAEAEQLPIDSGCRAGSCGTCSVGLLRGAVEYPAGQKFDCPPGHCLMCLAKPKGAIELDV